MVTLLIDGDVLAFIAATAAQNTIANPEVDSFGYAWAFASLPVGKVVLDNYLGSLMRGLGADHRRIALTDSVNWRHSVMPSYKSNRSGLMRPLLLTKLKEYLVEEHGAERLAGLEADDVLGIWATDPGWDNNHLEPPVVVGRDKDFKSIPGRHHTLYDYMGTADGNARRVLTVSLEDADRWHLIQALAGDRVDGYAGCPGLGMERAARIIDTPVRLVPNPGVITSGKNKGKPTVRWVSEPTKDLWACIVSHYEKAGLSEKDALESARVARILRHGEYNEETGEVKLWTPALGH